MRREQITLLGETLRRRGALWVTTDGYEIEPFEGNFGYGATSWRFWGGPRDLGETFASSLRNAVKQIQDYYRHAQESA